MSQTINSNKILAYIEDIIYLKRNHDGQGLLALQREGKEKQVSLEEVGFAFMSIMDDFTHYVDASQGLMEMRFRALVDSLDDETRARVLQQFEEAGDDLLISVEEPNDNDKRSE
ncbi:hypothetical protein JBP901_gp155 [Bacillus phage JBP901]|uniref:Uncharacterized protein n=1 Tax=Bacillus phage JBP901 TaxID=1498212 RepID=A0A0E3DFA9_9CAUD|nr:hypothetical protein JBP901_gp155 [Bacillus phage JBP901]AID17867.1 hypothetical protein JBP901_gp155 [Bacillus phage JBP901]